MSLKQMCIQYNYVRACMFMIEVNIVIVTIHVLVYCAIRAVSLNKWLVTTVRIRLVADTMWKGVVFCM